MKVIMAALRFASKQDADKAQRDLEKDGVTSVTDTDGSPAKTSAEVARNAAFLYTDTPKERKRRLNA
jgi:hypothetical protein